MVFPTWFLLNVVLHYNEEARFTYGRARGRFLRRFLCACCNCWEYKFALRVWLHFKNLKWIIPPYTQHNFYSWRFSFKVDCVEHRHKWSFSSPEMIFLKKIFSFKINHFQYIYIYIYIYIYELIRESGLSY